MSTKTSILFLFMLLIVGSHSFAQHVGYDTVYTLPPVTALGYKQDISSNTRSIQSLNAQFLESKKAQNLSDVLSHSNAYIKSYGLGSLAILSLRGSDASHTAVLWNGFNLQSPMNGVIDLALVPLYLIDDVEIRRGGETALFGGGAVAGSIHLNNNIKFGEGTSVKAGIGIGSFNSYSGDLRASISTDRIFIKISSFYRTAKNDFRFRDRTRSGSPYANQNNAAFDQMGIMPEFGFRITPKQRLILRAWIQNSEREISPSLTVGGSEASQSDSHFRLSGEWNFISNSFVIKARAGYFKEYIGFVDPAIALTADNFSGSFISEVEGTYSLNHEHKINGGVGNTYATASTDNFADQVRSNLSSVFVSYAYSGHRSNWFANLALREEYRDGKLTPPTLLAGLGRKIGDAVKVSANVSRNYRLPTFNDLNWIPGGNPDLLAESSWGQEIGVKADQKFGGLKTGFRTVVFSHMIQNRIQWLPNDVGIWSPRNLSEVWSRGVETSFELEAGSSLFSYQFNVNYSYTLATNKKVGASQENILNKQLIYTPQHMAAIGIAGKLKWMRFGLDNNLTGKRFYTSDNSKSLPAYFITDISFGAEKTFRSSMLRFDLSINNLWSTDYEAIVFRPMPGRHFSIRTLYQFKKNKNEN